MHFLPALFLRELLPHCTAPALLLLWTAVKRPKAPICLSPHTAAPPLPFYKVANWWVIGELVVIKVECPEVYKLGLQVGVRVDVVVVRGDEWVAEGELKDVTAAELPDTEQKLTLKLAPFKMFWEKKKISICIVHFNYKPCSSIFSLCKNVSHLSKVGQIGQFVVQSLHFLTGFNLIRHNFTFEMVSISSVQKKL